MIDFRYHIVSIVAVFFALAVGIVLGAGPLKEQVGDTLTSEVKQLRQDRTDLRNQLDEATTLGESRDDFITAGSPLLLADRLPGRSVAIVVAPGAEKDVVDGVRAALTDAGATIASTTTLESTWLDASGDADRATLASDLAAQLEVPTDPAPDGPLIDTVLARSLVGTTGTLPAKAADVVKALDDADLLSQSGDLSAATAAVMVTAPVTGDNADERDRRAVLLAQIAGALDRTSNGTVVAEATPTTAASASVVQVVRDDSDLARVVSTVDDGDLTMGQLSVAVALAQQVGGGVGQYGFGDGAGDPFPALTGGS